MKEEGKYSHLWMKYGAVIRVLLKKTENENQKLQLFKHEFEQTGHKQIANVKFNFDLINGRAVNIVSTTSIAKDLWRVLNDHPATKTWLKDRRIKITLGNSFQLQFEKIPFISNPESISDIVLSSEESEVISEIANSPKLASNQV
jgi:hypothetical protein